MRTKDVALRAVLLGLALVLSWVESLVPLSFAVPGVKVGLPNLVVVFALYRLGWKDAGLLSLLRVLLVGMLFGNYFALAYSVAGAALSLLVMLTLKRTENFSIAAVSMAGAVAHNIGQIAVAVFVLETARLVWYLPALLISGVAAGICIGLLGALLVERVKL